MTEREAIIWSHRNEKSPAIAFVLTLVFSFLGACYAGGWAILSTLLFHCLSWFMWFVMGASLVTGTGSSFGGYFFAGIILYFIPIIIVVGKVRRHNYQVQQARIFLHNKESGQNSQDEIKLPSVKLPPENRIEEFVNHIMEHRGFDLEDISWNCKIPIERLQNPDDQEQALVDEKTLIEKFPELEELLAEQE